MVNALVWLKKSDHFCKGSYNQALLRINSTHHSAAVVGERESLIDAVSKLTGGAGRRVLFIQNQIFFCFINFPILLPPPPPLHSHYVRWSDGMRCCRSDGPGFCFVVIRPRLSWAIHFLFFLGAFLFHKCPVLLPPPIGAAAVIEAGVWPVTAEVSPELSNSKVINHRLPLEKALGCLGGWASLLILKDGVCENWGVELTGNSYFRCEMIFDQV